MSLTTNSYLKPREIVENYDSVFKSTIHTLDKNELFKNVIGLDEIKDILMNAIYAEEPVHILLIGKPGCGKSLILESIVETFPNISLWIDTVTSSGIGAVESIILMGQRLRFLVLDEVEEFSRRDRNAFLNLMARGSISRKLADRNIELRGLKTWVFMTCNDLDKLQKYHRKFLSRCEVVEVPELDYSRFVHVAGKRLQKEAGIDNQEIGMYVAARTFHEFGEKTDMRRAIRIARMCHSHALRNNISIDKDVVDEIVTSLKSRMVVV